MKYVTVIESADGAPIGGKVFPNTVHGIADAINHAADLASENGTVDRLLVQADLTECQVFEEGGWSVRIVPMTGE